MEALGPLGKPYLPELITMVSNPTGYTEGAFRHSKVKVDPKYPPEFTEPRQVDIAHPLLTIADACGGQWPTAVRDALVELLCEARPPVAENQLLRLVFKKSPNGIAGGVHIISHLILARIESHTNTQPN
jgi:hypothetical protein